MAGGRKRTGTAGRSLLRDGKRLAIRNSGLEVWLYDEANGDRIRAGNAAGEGSGGMPANFTALTRQGLVVGYELQQDDDLDVLVLEGDPLTADEMAQARLLEPQAAFLRLPSGRLCVESNDASRIGPEPPTESGAVVELPPGDYRLTLYRIDHEALTRDGLDWTGPEEVIVLTRGGRTRDAARDLLPFESRRDNAWIGQYTISARSADALVWFGDMWDTCVLNLDSAAARTLPLRPGAYVRTHVPAIGLTLVNAFAASWDDARRYPVPAGADAGEYGYAAFSPMADWNGAEALFCRRHSSRTRIEDRYLNVWLPATVEILDPEAAPARTGDRLAPADLRTKPFFDRGFLGIVLSEVIPGAGDLDDLELPQALDMLDEGLAKLGLSPQGDFAWEDRNGPDTIEAACRLYTGLADAFAAAVLAPGSFEVVFLTELPDGGWIATGLSDELERRVSDPRVRVENLDESPARMLKAHRSALRGSKRPPHAVPSHAADAVEAFERFLNAAFDEMPT